MFNLKSKEPLPFRGDGREVIMKQEWMWENPLLSYGHLPLAPLGYASPKYDN